MKKVFVTALLSFLVTGGLMIDCPPTSIVDPNSIGFEYDPNLVSYKLMCVVKGWAGDEIVEVITACDPDGDPMTFALQNGPEGMLLLPGPAEDQAQIIWTAVEGIYYVDVYVMDHPPLPENALEDRASMIFKIYPENRAPIFTKCNGDLDANGKVDFNDFAIFASCWPKTNGTTTTQSR